MQHLELTNLDIALALNLNKEMERLKTNQTQLAYKCELDPKTIANILNAKANTTFKTLQKIADALEVSPLYLLREENEPT